MASAGTEAGYPASANATWATYSQGPGVAKYTTTTTRAARGSSATVISAAPPGSFYGGGVHPVPAHNFAPTQPARRFPGHFAPHRLCNHFSAHGWCKKAEACTFAHGIQELHADVQAQLAPAVNGVNPAPIVVGPKGQVSIAPHVAPAAPLAAGTKKVTYLSTSMPGGVTMPAGMISAGFSGLSTSAPVVAATEDPNFKFNAGAKPFAPPVELSASAKVFVPSPVKADDDGAAGGEGEQSDESASSPSRRRPAPAPLNLDESPTVVTVQPRLSLSQTIPALAGSPIPVHATRVGTTPVGSSALWQPLASPKTIVVTPARYVIPAKPGSVLASPTAAGGMVAHSMAMNVLSSPTAASVSTTSVSSQVLASPTASLTTMPTPLLSPTTKYVLRSPAGSPWPASPGTMVVSSPKPGTPVPINRGMLLQARNVSLNIGQGAPGLVPPTPITRAKGLGFAFPQPGVIVSKARSEVIKEA